MPEPRFSMTVTRKPGNREHASGTMMDVLHVLSTIAPEDVSSVSIGRIIAEETETSLRAKFRHDTSRGIQIGDGNVQNNVF